MDELFKLKQAIANLDENEVRQLLLLLFMKAGKKAGDYEEEVLEIAQSLIETFKEQAEEMTIENVHIVFSKKVGNHLKQAFRKTGLDKTEVVIYFPDVLSVGPMTEVHTLQGIEQRYNWFAENFHIEELAEMKQGFIQAIKEIHMINNNEKIIIWTCQNAHEQTGVRIVLALLQNHMNEIFTIDSFAAFHEAYHFPLMLEQGMPRLTEDLTVEQLLFIYKQKHVALKNIERGRYCEEGFEILATDNLLRSWLDGQIVHEDEQRDDLQIVSFIRDCQQGEQYTIDSGRIIMNVYSEMDQYTGEAWLDYRLRMLIAKGDLTYEGDLSSKFYSVK